jgi:hypothetical protein
MGRIARPSLLAQAAAPTAAAILVGTFGTQGMVAAILLTAMCNLVLSLVLFAWLRRHAG